MAYRIAFILLLNILAFDTGCNGKANPEAQDVFSPEALASAKLVIDGTQATMIGTIDNTTPAAFLDLLEQHPEVDTILLKSVPGSESNQFTFIIGRMLRNRGIKTHVPSDGLIVSGGTDLFIAGAARTIELGAQIGVHSWSTVDAQGDTIIGSELPRDNLLHRLFLAYYTEMGIPTDFYWFSINAAPPSGIHLMTPEELRRFGLLKPDPSTS